MPCATGLFEVVLALHIAAVMIAFGVTFAYPIMLTFVRRTQPRALPALHRVQGYLDRRLTSPGLGIVLLAGIYLASKLETWSNFYVQWGFGAIIVLGAMSGAFFAPRNTRMGDIAQRDIDASGEGEPRFSAEYETVARQLAIGGTIAGLIVLATIYFMVSQTGG